LPYKTILTEKRDGLGIITLNRPDRLNALSRTLITELEQSLTLFEQDDTIKAIIITGTGDKAFSAGADIHEMVQLSTTQGEIKRDSRGPEWLWHLAACRKPTIGAINGLAYGGGALIASTLDIRIGCERTTFRFLGAVYGRINSTWTLPMIVGWPMAKELLFTGRLVEAEEAMSIGLLNRMVDFSELMSTAIEMGKTIASNNDIAVQTIKDIIIRDTGLSWRDMLTNESDTAFESLEEQSPQESFKEFLRRTGK